MHGLHILAFYHFFTPYFAVYKYFCFAFFNIPEAPMLLTMVSLPSTLLAKTNEAFRSSTCLLLTLIIPLCVSAFHWSLIAIIPALAIPKFPKNSFEASKIDWFT